MPNSMVTYLCNDRRRLLSLVSFYCLNRRVKLVLVDCKQKSCVSEGAAKGEVVAVETLRDKILYFDTQSARSYISDFLAE